MTVKVGDTFTVKVTPSDSSPITGATVTSSAVTLASISPITLTSSEPVVNAVVITPDSTTAVTKLTANATTTDPLGLPVTLAYQWLQNGNVISGATAQTLSLSTLTVKKGDTFSVKVTPSDGTPLTGATVTSSALSVAAISPIKLTASAPVVTGVTITPDNAMSIATLTANATAVDPQNLAVTFAYQWLQNGNPITGATGQTLSLTGLTVAAGDTFTVQVTPSDGTPLTGVLFTSSAVTIATSSPITLTSSEPVVTAVTITPDHAAAVTALTAVPTTSDPIGLPVTVTYQWFQDGTAISGATGATLSLTPLTVKVGDTFTVEVTPSDSRPVVGALFTSSAATIATIAPITLAP